MNHASKVFTIFYTINQKITTPPSITITVIASKLVMPRGKAAWLRKIHVIKIAPISRAGMSTNTFAISYVP